MTIPKVSGSWLTGSLPARRRLGERFYGAMAVEHGDLVELRLATWRFVLVSHPDGVRHLLQHHPQRYSKGSLFGSLRVALGDGLFFAEGAAWRRQRRVLQPAFHPSGLAPLIPAVHAALERVHGALDDAVITGATADLHSLMTRLALDVISRALFGRGLTVEDADRLATWITQLAELLDARTFSLVAQALPLSFPIPLHTRIARTLSELDAWIGARIQDRHADIARGAPPGDDLLGTLLTARDPETGDALRPGEVRDQIMTLFLAGHETSASALAWCFALLCDHPTEADAVRDEVRAADLASVEGLRRLQRVDRAFSEALRLYPPGWTLTRQALEDDVVLGERIPAGTNLVICPYALHRDPRFWDTPDAFRPDRFPLQAEQRHAYLPFGAGPRACIGGWFATVEATLTLADLLARYRFEPAWTAPLRAEPSITLRPAGGVPVRVRQA
jgi:cytochrome P450